MKLKFNLADFVEALDSPQWITHNSAWIHHIPMTAVLLKLLKPQRFVELGTFRGDSYMTFCQGVVRLGLATKCTAIDTWRGDTHAGFYGPNVLEELRRTHDPLYGHFSMLMPATFDEALSRFEDGSIDLLHIDGHHTYEAVAADFANWKPKLSKRGVVLFHDTTVREKDFGVWKLWEELSAIYPAFNVPYGCGLGMLAVGDEVPKEMLDFIGDLDWHGNVILPQFVALGTKIEMMRTLMGLANDMQNGQAILNEWRKVMGQQVTQGEGVGAWENPRRYAGMLVKNTRDVVADGLGLLQENRAIRERLAARIGVVKSTVEAAVEFAQVAN